MNQEGNYQTTANAQYEGLRKILQQLQRKSVDISEAVELGTTLINFYEALASPVTADTEDIKWPLMSQKP